MPDGQSPDKKTTVPIKKDGQYSRLRTVKESKKDTKLDLEREIKLVDMVYVEEMTNNINKELEMNGYKIKKNDVIWNNFLNKSNNE